MKASAILMIIFLMLVVSVLVILIAYQTIDWAINPPEKIPTGFIICCFQVPILIYLIWININTLKVIGSTK
jgi:ABC-type Fe3+-siderophore transport system permease subunit